MVMSEGSLLCVRGSEVWMRLKVRMFDHGDMVLGFAK